RLVPSRTGFEVACLWQQQVEALSPNRVRSLVPRPILWLPCHSLKQWMYTSDGCANRASLCQTTPLSLCDR
ncbi:hypothetical protein NEUTE2DRAFT_60288, partial [Neurospora tetrasperma FGSC 2509]